MTALLDLDRVSLHYPLGGGGWFRRKPRLLRAVEQVSLAMAEGETLAIVGESGSGKSTLGYLVAGLRRPSAGTLRFRGADLGHDRPKPLRRAIQIVFQDPFSALDPRLPVGDVIAEPLVIHRQGSPSERRARAAALVEQVGLPADALSRYPHEFSGGQRQRIAIARALSSDPALIVADEPLSALDVSIQSQILNLLRDIQATRALAYLFISHDLAVVHHLADRVAVLYLGRLVEVAPRDDLFQRPSHPYTQALLAAIPEIGRGRRRQGQGQGVQRLGGEIPSPLNPPSGCVFHPRCPKAEAICRREAPILSGAPGRPGQVAACHFKD